MQAIEALHQSLIAKAGPFGLMILFAGAGLLLSFVALLMLLRKRKDPLARLRTSRMPEKIDQADIPHPLRAERSTDRLERYSTFLEPKSEREYSQIKIKLAQAGYRSRHAVRQFHFVQFALGMTFLTLGCFYATIEAFRSPDALTPRFLAISIILPGCIGYLLPRYWVTRRQQQRKADMIDGFPDALDLMLVCVEAGQSLDQSILRVAQEVRAGFPPLADEFDQVSNEVKAGKERATVLRDMAERSGVSDISSFSTVLIQSATFGTPVAEALRIFSAEMRDKRIMRAEERANTLPTKMTLATMLLTVPPLLIILVGPSIYEIYRTFTEAEF